MIKQGSLLKVAALALMAHAALVASHRYVEAPTFQERVKMVSPEISVALSCNWVIPSIGSTLLRSRRSLCGRHDIIQPGPQRPPVHGVIDGAERPAAPGPPPQIIQPRPQRPPGYGGIDGPERPAAPGPPPQIIQPRPYRPPGYGGIDGPERPAAPGPSTWIIQALEEGGPPPFEPGWLDEILASLGHVRREFKADRIRHVEDAGNRALC